MATAPASFGLALGVAAALAAISDATTARAQPQDAPPCDAVEVEYELSGNLQLSDTPMGKGDGVYRIGPGRTVLRLEHHQGAADTVKMVSYGMTERFTIDASAILWSSRVTADAKTSVAKDSCGVVATGLLSGQALTWKSDIRGARTDGATTCEGSLCGKFGAPPAGTSPLHVPPHDVRFQTWTFSPDMKTFKMANTWMSQSDAPRQTAHVALSGREVRRTCVASPACPGR